MTTVDGNSMETDEEIEEEEESMETLLQSEKAIHDFTEEREDDLIPKPRFKVTQTVYARDIETTGILYHAIVRKCQYGPKSRQVNIALHLAKGGKIIDIVGGNDSVHQEKEDEVKEDNQDETTLDSNSSWHYFIHHFGWNVKWDRWVEESNIYEDDEKGQSFAQKLREAHASIIKKETKDKAMQAVYKRSKELEQEIYQRQEDPINRLENTKEKEEQGAGKIVTRKRVSDKQTLEDWIVHEKCLRSMSLQGPRYSTSKDSGNIRDQEYFVPIPYPLKKILVDEWEVLHCGLYHTLPATLTVHNVLYEYFHNKIEMIIGGGGGGGVEKSTSDTPADADSSSRTKEYSDDELQSLLEKYPSIQEWYDMIDGMKLLFDQALPCQLLYMSEVAQYVILKNTKYFLTKSYCEVYSSEFLLRLLLKFPLFVEDGLQRNAFTKEQLGPIMYRLGDLVRFLQRDPGKYFTLSYRRKSADEIAMEKKLSQNQEELEAKSGVSEMTTGANLEEESSDGGIRTE